MLDFTVIKKAVHDQMDRMSDTGLCVVDVDKDALWETYLGSFPVGSNPIFRERTQHDCQCCKQFIRNAGGIVSIVNGELVSIWDVKVGGEYQVVADALAKLVKSRPIANVFLCTDANLGTDHNRQLTDTGDVLTWDHFHYKLSENFVRDSGSIGALLSETRSNKEVFKRSLDEISLEAIEVVVELIDQNSIYRGEENRATVALLLDHKKVYDQLTWKDEYCWVESTHLGPAAKIRNTAIGTLLVDVSSGIDLDIAVRSFESKVAPENYKRPTALITKKMIADAEAKVVELGIESALPRRYAVAEDITVNNVLFADRSAQQKMGGIFDELTSSVSEDVSKFSKIEEMHADTFIDNVLPHASSVELLFENKHENNLMSLIAPCNLSANSILKWGNNFSWSYNGDVTDSIKQRVKNAGGNVDGFLRCSLSWFNYDDLDIHVNEPNGQHISYTHKCSWITGGTLDVDMNVDSRGSRNAVENIVWADRTALTEGVYRVWVRNYTKRESVDVGFEAELEYDGTLYSFSYAKAVPGNSSIDVVEFEYSAENGIKILKSLPSNTTAKELWGISTQKFHRVSMVMNSPNHWDGEKTGNRHLFFILDKCVNANKARGLYNEFLSNELTPHRKVFEVLGAKMKTEASANQLSGLGFSSTKKDSVVCRVTGSFNRTIKIVF